MLVSTLEKLEPLCIAGGNIRWYGGLVAQYKAEHKITIWYSNSTSHYIPKSIIQINTCRLKYRALLFTIANRLKQPKCPQQMNKQNWYI